MAQKKKLNRKQMKKTRGGVIAIISPAPEVGTSEIVSPRDAASGLPTGKRVHKPLGLS